LQRNNFQRADTIASNENKFLYQESDEIHTIYRADCCIGKRIIVPWDPYSERIHEIWIVYFPIQSLGAEEKRECQLPILKNFFDRNEETSNPTSGILSQHIAWLPEEVIYQGVKCQRLTWFVEWKSKKTEEF
jgi:hypothetical protein